MTLVDLVVLAVGALAGWTGWRSGGRHTVVGVAGRLGGAAAGLGAAHLVAGTAWPFTVRVALEIAVAVTGLLVGGRLGRWVAPAPAAPSRPDRVVGVAVRAVTGVVLAAVVVAGVGLWGPTAAYATTTGSLTASAATPPVRSLAGDLRASLPADLDGIVPSGRTGRVSSTAALSATGLAATVQVVTTSASGTGGSTGSGFVVAGDRVVTAHHVVVAGADRVVVLVGERRFAATLAVDDPGDDVTVLGVEGLDVAPVTVSVARVAPGTAAVVAGYPGGGPLQTGTATVVGGVAMPAFGAEGVGLRPAYRLDAVVRPGNSGGPLFDASGAVIGMVDARSVTDDGVGFAITAAPVLAALA